MNLSQLLSRQKLVVLPMAVLVLLGLAWVYKAGPPLFQAKASIALMTPAEQPITDPMPTPMTEPTTTDPVTGQTVRPTTTRTSAATTTTEDPGNPLLRYQESSVIPELVSRLLSAPRVQAELRRRGLEGTFDLGRSTVFPYRGPIVDITTTAPTAEGARRDASLLIEEVEKRLGQVEEAVGVPAHQRIVTSTIVLPTNVNIQYASRMKRVAMGLILGIAGIIVVAQLSDTIGRRRRLRTGGATGSTAASARSSFVRPARRRAADPAADDVPTRSAARPGGDASPRPVGPSVRTSA